MIKVSASTRLELRSLNVISVGMGDDYPADITVDALTLLSMQQVEIGSRGRIDPGSLQTQCLRDIISRRACNDILLPKNAGDNNFDTIPWPSTNFTVVIGVTGNGFLTLGGQSSVKADRLLLCTDNGTVVLDGSVDVSGQGCGAGSSQDGRGASPFRNGGGYCDKNNNNFGGGGAHFGRGGNGCAASTDGNDHSDGILASSPDHCTTTAVEGGVAATRSDNIQEPLMSGAGGGCASPQGLNGNGGGVVVLHGRRLCLGTGGCTGQDIPAKLLAMGNAGASGGGGGGAGGSISIEVDVLEASRSSQMSVEGGAGMPGKNSGAGGGGGGGRMFVVVPRNIYDEHGELILGDVKNGEAVLNVLDDSEIQIKSKVNDQTWLPMFLRAISPQHRLVDDHIHVYETNTSTSGPFVHFHTNVSVSGGRGMYFNTSGLDGALTSNSCPLHYELAPLYDANEDPMAERDTRNKLKCIQCSSGYFQNVSGKGKKCSRCHPGMFQKLTGQNSCLSCHNNSYCLDWACSQCQVCAPGNYTNSSLSSCQTCPICPNQEAFSSPDNIICKPKEHACFGVSCKPSEGLPSMHLLTPSSSPAGRKPQPVVGSRACFYECEAGYIKPNCITPFELFLQLIGGWPVFIGGIVVSSLLFALTFGVVCKRVEGCTGYQQRQRFIRLEGLQRMPGSPYSKSPEIGRRSVARGESRGSIPPLSMVDQDLASNYNSMESPSLSSMGGLSGLGDIHANSPSSSLLPSTLSLSRSRGGGGDPGDSNQSNAARQVPWYVECRRMGLQDLNVHAFRLIPDGTNSPSSPWRIAVECNEHNGIGPLVIPELYSSFAQALNISVAWPRSGWEIWCYWCLLALWYPLASEFLNWRRDVRAGRLVALVLDGEGGNGAHHQMLSGHRARVLHNCLRLNISDDCTMFWLDVLYQETTPPPTNMRRNVGAPRLPMLLCLAGDGTSRDPLHLDLNDVLINSIPQLTVLSDFIDNRWVDFVLSLNENLRTVDCDHLSVTIEPVLKLINRSNAEDYLKGLHLQLVLMWPNSTHMNILSSTEMAARTTVMPEKYEVERSEARLAIHISAGRARSNSRPLPASASASASASSAGASSAGAFSGSDTTSNPMSPTLSPALSSTYNGSISGPGSSMESSGAFNLSDCADSVMNDKTWKFAKRRASSGSNKKDRRRSAEQLFATDVVKMPALSRSHQQVTKTTQQQQQPEDQQHRPMSIRDRMLGSAGDRQTSNTNNRYASATSNRPPLSPNNPRSTSSLVGGPSMDSFAARTNSRRSMYGFERKNSASSGIILERPEAIDFDRDDDDVFDVGTSPSPDSSDPDMNANNSNGVLPSDAPRRTKSLTTYHDIGVDAAAMALIFVSDEFQQLDYAAVQTLRSAKRQACSRDKCIFHSILIVAVLSFLVTLVLFFFSVIDSNAFQRKPDLSLESADTAYHAGQIFLGCALIIISSHVALPRFLQVKCCASHMTNVMTRNR